MKTKLKRLTKEMVEAMSSDELEQNVLADLSLSGFPAEMRAARAFRRHGWRATLVAYYFDLDEKQTRESDIRASFTRESMMGMLQLILAIEVKSSFRPWVVFRERSKLEASLAAAITPKAANRVHMREFTGVIAELAGAIPCRTGWFGTGVHESFKQGAERGTPWAAMVSAAKAADDLLPPLQDDPPERLDDGRKSLRFVKPVVVFDGPLYSAGLDGDGNIGIREEDSATVRFEFSTANYTRGAYYIDVVTLGALETYASELAQACEKAKDNLIEPSEAFEG